MPFIIDDMAIAAAIAEATAAAEAAAATAAGVTAASAGSTAAAGALSAAAGATGAGAAGAGMTGGLLGATGAGASGAGLLGAGEAGAGAGGLLGAGEAGTGMAGGLGSGMYGVPMAGEAAPTVGASGALSYTTPSVFQTGSGMSGLSSMPTGAEAVQPSLMSQMGGYMDQAGKAAKTYTGINAAMGGGGGGARPAPQARPIFQDQGQAPQITPQQQAVPENQFARMLLEKRMRGGMLG